MAANQPAVPESGASGVGAAVKALEARGGEIVTSTPSQLADLIKADSDKMGRLIKEAGISLQ